MCFHVLASDDLSVYDFLGLTAVVSSFVGYTFWPLDCILSYCFSIDSSLLSVLWIFLVLFGPQKFIYAAIFRNLYFSYS